MNSGVFYEKVEIMRMWMLNPRILCTKHLTIEHDDIHRLINLLITDSRIEDYDFIDNIQFKGVIKRHDAIVCELLRRNIFHTTPLEKNDINIENIPDHMKSYVVDSKLSLKDLLIECNRCKMNVIQLKGSLKILNPFWSGLDEDVPDFLANVTKFNLILKNKTHIKHIPDMYKNIWDTLPLMSKYLILDILIRYKIMDFS